MDIDNLCMAFVMAINLIRSGRENLVKQGACFSEDGYVYGIPEIHFFEVYTYRKNKGWVTIKSLENMKVELDSKLINDIMKWDEVEETSSGAAATLLKRVVEQIEQQKEEDRARVEDIVESVQC